MLGWLSLPLFPPRVMKACAIAAAAGFVFSHVAASRRKLSSPSILKSSRVSLAFRSHSTAVEPVHKQANYNWVFLQRFPWSLRRASVGPSSSLLKRARGLASAAEGEHVFIQEKQMAWRSHGHNNQQLVENLRKNGVFQDQRVYDAMLKVDRGYFVQQDPYLDMPQSIGFDATISAPHMHAMALEHLKESLVPGNRVLDVGSGTGYLTVCMALMVAVGMPGGGASVGIDYVQGLVDLSRKNVQSAFPELLSNPRFLLLKGDGWEGGPSEFAPYHAIHVGAAAAKIPAKLLEQLAPGGIMVIPVECRNGKVEIEGKGKREVDSDGWGGGQVLVSVRKADDGSISVKYITSVMYVPLVKSK